MINLTLVTREGCIHCAQTKEILKKIKPEYPELAVEEIDMITPRGQEPRTGDSCLSPDDFSNLGHSRDTVFS